MKRKELGMTKSNVPVYNGTLRNHSIRLPHCIRECSGIRIFGMRIKSIAFTTDVAIIKNINADAVIAVYPFTPQPTISQAIIGISDVPVFVGVGGGITGGDRAVRLAIEAENQGAFGVVVNAPISDEVISRIKQVVDIPVIATIVSERMDIRRFSERIRRSGNAADRKKHPHAVPGCADSGNRRAKRRDDFEDHSRRRECHHLFPAQQRRTLCRYYAKIPRKTINIAFESCR
mgnify:CR=1 FL=1